MNPTYTINVSLTQTGNSISVSGISSTNTSIVSTAFIAGPTGDKGADGANGTNGVGVIAGGTTGQVLAKKSNTDYDTDWIAVSGTGTVTSVTSADANLTVATGTTTPVLTVASAPKLLTARTINGVAFDGTANITVADSTKQPTLVSGTNIKTINGTTLLGSGDLAISGGSSSPATLTAAGIVKKTRYNVLDYSAVGDGTTDDTTAIQNAINAASADGGGIVWFPAKTFLVTSLNLLSNVSLHGSAGSWLTGYGTTLKTTTASANLLYYTSTGAGLQSVTIQDLRLEGPGTTGEGINLANGGGSANPHINIYLKNVKAVSFATGFEFACIIASTFDNVTAETCTTGFYFNGGAAFAHPNTSLNLTSCYANGCSSIGYNFQSTVYTSLNNLAADSCGTSYVFDTCNNITGSSLGTEWNNPDTATPGDGYKITNSHQVTLLAPYTFQNKHYSFWVTGSSTAVVLVNISENTPVAATNSLVVDAGSYATIIGLDTTTAKSIAGSVEYLNDGSGGLSIPGYAYFGGTTEAAGALQADTGVIVPAYEHLYNGTPSAKIKVFEVGNFGTTPVNYLGVEAAPTGSGADLYAAGADANIDLPLNPKGTGTVKVPRLQIGTTATAGYVLTTDASGNGTWQASPSGGMSNPMTTLGDIIYEDGTPTPARLSGNITTGKQFLTQTGTGTISAAPTWGAIVAADIPVLNQNTTGTSANVTGTVAVANGGTGSTTQQAAINTLTGTQAAGKYLRSDGTNATLAAIAAADVPVLNQNTTGTAANVTGTVAIANGGTGAASLPTGLLKGAGTGAITAAVADTDYTTPTGTGTLTNKRVTKRVVTLSTNAAAPAVNTDSYDVVHITAQTAAITGFTMTGTPVDGDTLRVSITGTAAVGITWGTSFEASTVALPTTTTGTSRLDVGFFWNTETSKWRCMASA